MLSFVFLVIGFALMIWGADKFVAGASALARKLGVSPLLIGLTIVAFGTSMPELAVSVTAALRGANEIAVGNVVGSNIFNLLVVAGLSAAVCPLVMDKTLLRRDWPLSILAAVLLLGAIAPDLTIARWEGVVLLIIFAFILTYQIRTALQNREQLAAAAAEAEAEEAEAPMSAAMIWVNILLGLACIVIGGQLAVNGATGIARMFGLSETLIGLTIVAIGTSLPELVTSIVAARKGQNEIAMGNVIGSNLFNILLISDVCEYFSVDRQSASRSRRYVESGLRHQRKQSGSLQRYSFTSGIRSGYHQGPVITPQRDIYRNDFFTVDQRMTRRLQLHDAVFIYIGLFASHLDGKAPLCHEDIEFQQQLLVVHQIVIILRNAV